LELLHTAVPDAAVIAVLNNPAGYSSAEIAAESAQALAEAAAALGVRLVTVDADKAADFDGAFAQIGASRAGALLVMPDPFFFAHHRRIVAFANRARLPAIYEWGDIARDGGLMAYGDSIHALYRRAGDYVGRVLKGAKPADLPV
jgi:putative tryptophan/tyrosine transport system substrate-binding protein